MLLFLLFCCDEHEPFGMMWPIQSGGPEQMVASGNNQGLGIVGFVSFIGRIGFLFLQKFRWIHFFPLFFIQQKRGILWNAQHTTTPPPPPKIKDWEPKI